MLIEFVLLVLGGSKRIPEMANSMGSSVSEIRKGKMKVDSEIN